jgi:hypothetical protein
MTGLVRRATLITAAGLLAAAAASAGVPSLGNSTVGAGIILGGQNASGTADVHVAKTITVRDAANNPVPNSVVVITFSTCTANDIRLCSVQNAGMFVNCGAKSVSATTNASGIATFTIIGGAINNPPPGGLPQPAGVGAGCATVTADGVNFGNLTVAAADQNDTGGVNVIDTGDYNNDRFNAYRGRSDFDGNGVVNVLDTSTFLNIRFGVPGVPGSTVSGSPNC